MEKRSIEFEHANAICYSGFRDGQSPGNGIYPTYEQTKEDLLILVKHWKYIRLYDTSCHAETVLDVIAKEKLDLKVMLGCCLAAEVMNDDCPWETFHSEATLMENRVANREQMDILIGLANEYPDIIFAVSAGNEATVEWTDHLVPVESIIEYVSILKASIQQPVTFCENYVPWQEKLDALGEVVDFISLHTYPVWEYKGIHEAFEYTKENYYSVKHKYPGKPVVITEAGWATNSNGRGIDPSNVNEDLQKAYYHFLMEWTREEKVLTFVFEAFDENWKGSDDVYEPENTGDYLLPTEHRKK